MFNKDKANIEGLLDAIKKIEVYTRKHSSAEELFNDTMAFDAVLMNFIVLSEMAERISKELKSAHPSIPWNEIKGFRNLIAHDYFGVDADEVWQIIQKDLQGLKSVLTSSIVFINH